MDMTLQELLGKLGEDAVAEATFGGAKWKVIKSNGVIRNLEGGTIEDAVALTYSTLNATYKITPERKYLRLAD